MLQAQRKLVVLDYDDDLLGLPEHNPAREGTDPDEVIRAVRLADAIIVTSDALAAVYRPYAKRIGVIPNYMPVRDWPVRGPTSELESPEITIGVCGLASHHEDWRQIEAPMRRILAEYPQVKFLTAGYRPDYLADLVTEHVPWQDVFAYQRTVNRIDIGLCPLLDDRWNLRKTPIKAMEYALASAAVVASPILYRATVQGRGTLARTEDEWYEGIKKYLDPQARQRDAKALRD